MTAINNIQLNLNLLTPPLQSDSSTSFSFSGADSPYQYHYDITAYIVRYNIFRILSGMGGLAFGN